jgi:hypothetical protein
MAQLSLTLAKQKTIATVPVITAMTGVNVLIQVTSTAHGLETGDIVQIAGVASPAGAANGQWVITKVDANNFTLNNSLGSGTWGSGGTITHLGWATPATLVDNTVFANGTPDYTLQARIEELLTGANVRVVFEDCGASTFIDAQPVAVFQSTGNIGVAAPGVFAGLAGQNDKMFTAKKYDVPDTRMAASGNNLRAKFYVSGGAGKTAQFSAWLTY